MAELNSPLAASLSLDCGETWLQRHARIDWRTTGLPCFEEWDPAVAAAARLVSHSSAPMALMFGPRGIVFGNSAADSLFGGEHDSINGRSVFDILPHAAPFYASVLNKVLAGTALSFSGQPIRIVKGGQTHTGWYNLEFTPVVGSSGEILGALGLASDVSEMMRSLRNLSESEQRLRLALEGSGMVGIWTLDIASGMSTADANVARTYGVGDAAVEGKARTSSFLSAVHPEDRQRVKDTLTTAIRTGTPYRCRYRIVTPEGAIRWSVTSGKPILGEEGNTERMLGVVIDVTDQMATASALEESRFHFQTLTETLPQIVWSCDAEGRHDYFSARWSEFTGIAQEDITEETWKHLVYPEHQSQVASVWEKARLSGEPYDLDYRFRHHTGEYRWLRVMALPVRDADGNITRWFGTSTDVHEAYLIAEERERLGLELVRIATEDQLTGALTRRAFIERASTALKSERRSVETLGLMMLDIDHFKSINDTHGHPVGDKVLAATVSRIASTIRGQDFVGRLGGEEFAVIMPKCSRMQLLRVAERIRNAIEQQPVSLDNGDVVQVTTSIGLASGQVGQARLDDLLAEADRALYMAKSNGRNQTVCTWSKADRHIN